MKKFMIIINGPAAAGKTTLAHAIWKKIPRTAILNLDEVKWLISDYKNNSFDLTLASDAGFAMAEVYLKNRINVIVEKAFCEYKYIKHYVALAKKSKSKLFIFNLEAPLEILKKRARQRPRTNLKHNKPKLSLAKTIRLYHHYTEGKFPVTRTFDTSKLSKRKIINMIMKEII